MSDEEMLAAFEDLSLPPSAFDHRGHLRIAWIVLRREPWAGAVERVCSGIRAYATHLGAAGKYHRTVTEALMCVLAARGAADPAVGWEAFLARNEDLVRDARGVLRRYYSDERLGSEEAREGFVAPDREPLPELTFSAQDP